MGVADLLVPSSLASTSMSTRWPRAVRIDVAVIVGAAGFAPTPILTRPAAEREAVGVLEILWTSTSARTSTAPTKKKAEGEGIVEADVVLASSSATSPMPPNPTAQEPLAVTARKGVRVAGVARVSRRSSFVEQTSATPRARSARE